MSKFLLCVLFLVVPQFVQATPVSIAFTGVTAQLFDSPGYIEEGHGGAGGGIYFGGPGGMNTLGGAAQFTVLTRTVVDYVLSDFSLIDWSGTAYDPPTALLADFTFVFYDQTIENHEYCGTFPDCRSEIKRSDVIGLFGFGIHRNVSSEYFGLWLDPGTYWLGIEEGPNRISALTYVENIQMQGYRQAPEPSSIVLFSMGLLFVCHKRKKGYRKVL